jgi:hypothetical protein
VLVASCGLLPCLFVRFSRANRWISCARFFSDCSRRRRIPALRSNRRGRASDSHRSSSLSARLASGRRRDSGAVPENCGVGVVVAAGEGRVRSIRCGSVGRRGRRVNTVGARGMDGRTDGTEADARACACPVTGPTRFRWRRLRARQGRSSRPSFFLRMGTDSSGASVRAPRRVAHSWVPLAACPRAGSRREAWRAVAGDAVCPGCSTMVVVVVEYVSGGARARRDGRR